MTLRVSNAARSAAADAIRLLVDGGADEGELRIYSGSQPAGPDTAITSQTLLATFTLDDPAFGAASNGVTTLAGTPLAATGAANGTATWFRILNSSGTAIVDGAVGTSGAELNLNTTTVSSGVALELTSGSITMPAS